MRNSLKIGAAPRTAKAMPAGELWAMLRLRGLGSDFTVRDQFGTLPDKTMQGTTASVWSDPANGAVWSGDNYVLYTAAEVAPLLGLAGFTGRLILAMDFAVIPNSGTISATEYPFCIGRYLATGGTSARGTIHVTFNTARILQLNYRDRASADGGIASNQVFGSTAISGNGTTPVRTHIAFAIDFAAATPTVNYYRNGVLGNSYALTFNGIDRPTFSGNDALVVGGRHDGNAYVASGGAGSATPSASGMRIDNFTIVRSDTMTGVREAQIVQRLHRWKGERP